MCIYVKPLKDLSTVKSQKFRALFYAITSCTNC